MGKGADPSRKGKAGRRLGKPSLSKMAIERAEAVLAARASSKRLHALKQKKTDAPARSNAFTYELPDRPPHVEHVKAAIQYARRVVAQQEVAGKLVQLACARFLRMGQDPRFKFDARKAARACLFIEQMPHVKGRWDTPNIKLGPWQCLLVCGIFGFYWANEPHRRVTKTVYIEVARKNAKSTLAAAIGLYMLTEDGEEGAEVYSAATTHKQALAIFDTAHAMATRQQGWQQEHGIMVGAHKVSIWGTLSKFEALHAQGETLDGLNVHCALIDELHAHKTRAVYDVLETAVGSRVNPLLFNITTAGHNKAGVCYEVRDYAIKVANGVVDDPTFFGMVYTIDPEDLERWDDPAVWKKANPNLDVSVYRTYLEQICTKAKATPAAVNNFLTKHLNVWVNAGSPWMDMAAWNRCAQPELKLEDFKGEECIVGMDLAARIDIASKAFLFRKLVDDAWHYYAIVQHYLPEDAASATDEETERIAQYPGWVREGRIRTTPGSMLDFDVLEDDLLKDAETVRVREIAVDPYQAAQISAHLSSEGFTVVDVRPTVMNFSQPMKEVEALVLAGLFHHNGCPVLEWMASNVVCHRDQKDNVYPRKEFPENKIDGIVAILMAMNRWLNEPLPSVYSERGMVTL